MKEIIVIHTYDPEGSIFRSILEALKRKEVQILHATDLELSALTLRDIEIFSKQRQVGRFGNLLGLRRVLYPLLHGPLAWAYIRRGAAV